MVARDGNIQIQRRVLYIGSAVPLETSEGLDAIQQPLKERYPCDDDSNIQGVDAVLTILPDGMQLHYIQDSETVVWFPISSLTICAAVRCIHMVNGATGEKLPKFISLSNPASRGPNSKKPAVFTAITRRTTGKKVLECHGFICRTDGDALDLVQCAKDAGFRNRFGRGPPSHIGPPSGRMNTSLLRNESFSSRSTHNPNLRLLPGSPLARKEDVAPEFYDTPPTQGYFYSGGEDHVRSYTLNRVNGESSQNRPQPSAEHAASTLPSRPVLRRVMSPPPVPTHSPTIPARRYPVGHPPPMPPPRRFFSPPPRPPSHRRYGYGLINQPRDPFVFMPPPPIYVDTPYAVSERHMRHRLGSESSGDSGSRSPSPHANGETSTSHGRRRSSSGSSTLRRDNKLLHHHHQAVNGNGAAESSSEVSSRPRTPPVNHAASRMSRKERHDFQRSRKAFHEPNSHSDDMYARRVYPEYPGYYFYGYPPMDPAYGVHPRHLSMPPPVHRISGPAGQGRRIKKDKGKKKKKKKPHHLDDASTDSYGYNSEIPAAMMDRSFPSVPRDWRKHQFKNERAFVHTFQEGSRRGFFSNNPPTAYALNQPRGHNQNEELDLDEP